MEPSSKMTAKGNYKQPIVKRAKFIINDVERMSVTTTDDDNYLRMMHDNAFVKNHFEEFFKKTKFKRSCHPIVKITRINENNELETVYEEKGKKSVDKPDEEQKFYQFSERVQRKSGINDGGILRKILKLYLRYFRKIGPLRRFPRKSAMWEAIAMKMKKKYGIEKTSANVQTMVENYRAICRKAVVNNSKTGRAPVDIPHGDIYEKLSYIDDSIKPELIRSARTVRHFK